MVRTVCFWRWRIVMALVTQMSPAAMSYFSSNGTVQIQHLVVPRSWLSCTSYGIRGTLVAGTTLCYPACSGCPGMPETLAKSGFSQKCPISMGISEKHFHQAGRDRSFSRQEIGLLTYTFFTAWILSPLFFSHLTPCTMWVFFTGEIWLKGPATWKVLPDSCSLVKDRFGCLCTKRMYKPKAFVPLEAFLFCDISACWSSYLEEQMLKIKIFLSQASSLAVCLARLYLIIFLLVCSCKEKTKEKNRQLKCIKLISKWVCRTRKSQEEPHLFVCICCCMWECKFTSN